MKRIQEIISEFKQNNLDSFDEFYEETKKLVYFTISTILKNQETIQDIMQDSYLRFLHNIDKCDSSNNPKAYLAMIARNLAINYYNRNKKIILDEEYLRKIPEDVDSSNSKVDLGIIDYLEGIEKEIVSLHIINDLKFREIADIINKPLGTVLWIYRRSINKLKKKVGE